MPAASVRKAEIGPFCCVRGPLRPLLEHGLAVCFLFQGGARSGPMPWMATMAQIQFDKADVMPSVDRKTSARDWGKFTHLCLLRAPPCSSRGVRGRHVQRCGGASCKSHLPMAIVTGQLGSPMKMTRTSVQEDPRASWHCTGRLADTEQLQLSAAAWHNSYSSYACRVDSGNCESS